VDFGNTKKYIDKWQKTLRLADWDIRFQFVDTEWRKTGDIKIDADDRSAVLLVNRFNPKQDNLEELIIHELLHLKLHGLDQMIETLMECVYGKNEDDPQKAFAYHQFMSVLESTVHDLTKSFLLESGENKELSFGRLAQEIRQEIGA